RSTALIVPPSLASSGVIPPPKCKTDFSRRSAFSVLAELIHENPHNLHEFISLLFPMLQTPHSGGENLDDGSWEFETKSDEKSESGYVGLKNLGSICMYSSLTRVLVLLKCCFWACSLARARSRVS